MYTRREMTRLTLAALPGTALLGRQAFAEARPNSVVNGVHVGVITYSYRSMPDQGGDATLRYIVESGISEIEMMNGPAEAFAGAPRGAARGAGGSRGRGQPLSSEQQAAQQAAQREAGASALARISRKAGSRSGASKAAPLALRWLLSR